jgi:DNA-binding NarL/FixJ family response regulator
VASLILIVCFVLCLAMAVAAALLGRQLGATYRGPFHRLYFYYLAAFYLFAVYGFWGQILGRALLALLETNAGVVETVASFVSVLGVPMLFVAWLMLINMAYAVAGAAMKQAWLALHAAVFVLLALAAWLGFAALSRHGELLGLNLTYAIVAVLVVLEFAYVAAFAILVYRARHRRAEWRRFALLIAGAFLLRSAALPLAFAYPSVVIAVLVYFASNLLPLLYVRANADKLFEPVKAESPSDESMDPLLEAYGITKRERQIVGQICAGKTNQQIADTLFISLQTVKDHTHRIYSKMGVKSRIQLVQRVTSRGAPAP